MLGIGVSTFNRPEHLRWVLTQIKKHTTGEYKVFVYNDGQFMTTEWTMQMDKEIADSNFTIMSSPIQGKGIARSKNECLYALKDCDHIILLDDDVAPITDNWQDYFINSGYNHSCYMTDAYQRSFTGPVHTSYQMSSGVFIYLTKAVLDKVGYFNPKYGRYGYEHAGYSHRIFEAGLTPSRFICLNDTNKYIYALDLNGVKGYEWLDHKRTITEEERTESCRINNSVYHEETTNHQIYYEFHPDKL